MAAQREQLFSPIKSARAFEEVAGKIKDLILSRALRPGERLPSETELAQQFNVGRQTMREAFRMLETNGIISIKKGGGGGAFIADTMHLTIGNLFMDAFRLRKAPLDDLTQARIEVESLVLNHALENIDEKDLADMRENLEQAERKIKAGQVATSENVAFHKLLAQASKNFVYMIIMECVMAVHENLLNREGVSLETSAKVVEAHRAIFQAIEAADREKARKLCCDHLLDVKKRVQGMVGCN